MLTRVKGEPALRPSIFRLDPHQKSETDSDPDPVFRSGKLTYLLSLTLSILPVSPKYELMAMKTYLDNPTTGIAFDCFLCG